MNNNLGLQIANYLNDINHNTFTPHELKQCIEDYNYMIQTNDIQSIIETLQEEYISTNDNKALELIKQILNKL